MKRASITGSSGFLGSSLNKRLLSMGWETYPQPRAGVDYLFLFGSPSSDHWYKYAPTYSLRETIENFINAIDFCQNNGVKLVYPSSGTVNEGTTNYAKGKRILETIASMCSNILGVRIYAGYGVGEGHKREYASTVYQFAKQMKNGETPVIWGDGKQTRDWVYIDDIVDNIIKFKDMTGIVEIGTGVNHSTNDVIRLINKALKKNIVPTHIEKPKAYINDTICENPCSYNVSLEEGIKRIINSL